MKKCTVCKELKPESEFYPSKQQASGLTCPCKECHKARTRDFRLKKLTDPAWREKEIARSRAKYVSGNASYHPEKSQRNLKKWYDKNPGKRKAHWTVSNAIRRGVITKLPCDVCGDEKSEAHHDDYAKPLAIRWLCRKHHSEHHIEVRRLERFTANEIEIKNK